MIALVRVIALVLVLVGVTSARQQLPNRAGAANPQLAHQQLVRELRLAGRRRRHNYPVYYLRQARNTLDVIEEGEIFVDCANARIVAGT